MNLILYFGKIIFVSGILYSYYWFVLRNKQFHLYNRFYLIITVAISLILPCITISFQNNNSTGAAKILHVISVNSWEDAVVITPHHNWSYSFLNWQNILYAFYFLISLILILVLAKTIYYILRIAKKYNWENIDDIKLFYTHEPQSPFSFFQNIFWNKELDISSSAGNQILRHEIYHVRKNHSFDILFLEIIKCIFWFNPFFFLIKKEIKVIHEFLADEYATSESDKYSYAELLVWQTVNSKQINIINTFFHNQIKRRIAMITQSKNKRYYYLSRVMVLPVLLILFCAFGTRIKNMKSTLNGSIEKQNAYSSKEIKSFALAVIVDTIPNTIISVDGKNQNFKIDSLMIDAIEKIEVTDKAVMIYKKDKTILQMNRSGQDASFPMMTINPTELKKISVEANAVFFIKKDNSSLITILDKNYKDQVQTDDDNIIFTKVEIGASYPGGQQEWIKYLMNSFRYPDKAVKEQIQGTVVVKYIVDKEGNVSDVVAESGPTEGGLREEAIRVIKNSGKWVPAMQNGRKVKAYNRQPIIFKLQEK
ncbi:MAG TPA: M56 family metallopeptidase [Puia sp.]|jgi:TonB family protein|nr:M56 family metallopeptidase [Puia sp.]